MSRLAIGAALEVHRLKGPGLIESIYERYLARELERHKIVAVNQRVVRIKNETEGNEANEEFIQILTG
jgi:GxxExxY protein